MKTSWASAIACAALGVATAAAAVVIDFSVEPVVVTDIGGGDFTFVQAGFTDEASVMGSFTATDFNNDGQIFFSRTVPAFALDFAGLFGLVYDLDGDIGDGLEGEGVDADFADGFWDAGPGPFQPCDARSRAASSSSPRSPNPAPSRCSAWACSVSA